MAHRSPWNLPRPPARTSVTPLEGTVSADVCVVGGGVAGLLTALELAERGRSVVVLERQAPGAGDTALTTSHLTAMLDVRYCQLSQMHGEQAAVEIAKSHLRAIAHLERVTNRYDIDCDFHRVSGFLCAQTVTQAAKLKDERDAAIAAGIRCELVRRAPRAIADGPALHVPNQAQMDPLKFLAGVIETLKRLNVKIYAPVTVQKIEPLADSHRFEIGTSVGATVAATHVVVATGTPINDRMTMHTKQAAYRTYAVSLQLDQVSPFLYWDMEDPYHYVRTAIDAVTQSPILIVGGEDHRVGQGPESGSPFDHLVDWARARFPEARDVLSQWSGQVFEPHDGLAFIGRNPGSKGEYIVTGESGNGMTYSAIAAELIADLIDGKPNPSEKLYEPSRKPTSLSAIGEFVRENLNTAEQYTDWLGPADESNADDIPRGHGAVVRRGLKRVAIYVDDAGRRRELSATCPHLGGVVAWNPIEKSWDCPCHGSRFDCRGAVIEGPAATNLEPLAGDQ